MLVQIVLNLVSDLLHVITIHESLIYQGHICIILYLTIRDGMLSRACVSEALDRALMFFIVYASFVAYIMIMLSVIR